MDIRLISVTVKNFKRFEKETTFVFNGRDASVFARNEKGKTTINDAVVWLLFGKDSEGKSDFDIKCNRVVRPEVLVSAVFSVDGKQITLAKTLVENWVKKRGEETETFSGNVTHYYINEIEKKQGEYKAFLDGIIKEDRFRNLTSASWFLKQKPADMRKILLGMVGNVSDTDIAGDDPELQELVYIMQDKGWTLEDVMSLSKQHKTAYAAEQSQIGARMDEVRKAMPEERDWNKLQDGLKQGEEYLRDIDSKLSTGRTAALEGKKKQAEIGELRIKAARYKTELLKRLNDEYTQLSDKKRGLESHISLLTQDVKGRVSLCLRLTGQIDAQTALLERLKAKYLLLAGEKKAAAERVFVPIEESAANCKACGQKLPGAKIAQMNADALDLFDRQRAADMADVEAKLVVVGEQGKQEKKNKTDLEAQLSSENAALEAQNKELELAKAALSDVLVSLSDKQPADDIDLTDDKAYLAFQERIDELEAELSNPDQDTDKLLEAKSRLQEQVDSIKKLYAGKEKIAESNKRLEELEQRGQVLASLIAAEERMKYLCERLSRAKSERLSSSINGMFESVEFRLFQTQINGGIAEDCTPLAGADRVDYWKNGSRSQRIRADLDIIRAFQRFEGVSVFVFVDNCESANYLRDMDGQVIKTYVSNDDEIRIEVQDK